MLGYTTGTATTRSKYGEVSSDFSMDDMECIGNETSILNCGHTTIENCSPREGAGVICTGF